MADYAPEKVEAISGVPAATLRELADLYGEPSRKVVSLWCMGVNQHIRGTWMNNLITNLHLLTGEHASRFFVHWLDLAAPGHPAPARPIAGNLRSGVTGAAVAGDSLLVMARNSGLVVMRPQDSSDIHDLPFARLAENQFGHKSMNGLATAVDDLLVVNNAAWSMVRVIDVADRAKPRLIEVIRTAGNPGRATVAHGQIVIPDGYEGVRIAPLARLRPQPATP